MPRARFAVAAVLVVLAAAFGASEIAAARDRAAPAETEVDRDVEPARARLAAALAAIESTCAEATAEALARTADVADRAKLFASLAEIRLPQGAGLFLEDVNGGVLAWTGATVDDAAFAKMPRTSDGPWFVETPSSRRLAVRRTRASPRALDGVPVLAVCHVPFAESFPPRNRALTPTSLERDVAHEFRVDEDVRILPPDSADGEPAPSAFGGALARLDVRPMPSQSWNEAVDAALAGRRAAILALLVLTAAAALGRECAAIRAPRTVHVARAAIVLAARAALGLLPLSSATDLGVLTDESAYSHVLPLDLAGSPLSLALTCAAACLAAASLRRAARETAPRGGPAWRTLAATIAAALVGRAGLAVLVGDVVENSTVEFFSPDTILPRTASSVLLAALLAAAVAAVFLVEAAWTAFPPAEKPSPPRALGASLVLAAALAPLGPDAPHPVALALVAVAGFAAALAVALHATGPAVRAAIVPLGAAVALFAPIDRQLHEATRHAVERSSRRVSDEPLYVANTLDAASRSPALADALRAGSLPHDLALRLWTESPLAGRPGGSSLSIESPAAPGERERFSIGLPPTAWLPDPPAGSGPPATLPGRGSGAEGRWIVGERVVEVDGRRAATLRAILEVRPPAAALPELQVLGTSRSRDAREDPPLAVSRYARDGRLVETNDPYRPAGAPLDPELRRIAVDERRDVWRESPQPDAELEVYVRPDVEDGEVTAVRAFSYDTGGTRALVLRGTRAALCGALVALLALVATARSWTLGARSRLASRLVVSYAIVAALPLTVLGWANREISQGRADEATRRELIEAISLVRSALHEDPDLQELAELPPRPGPVQDLRSVAYAKGRHANVFLGPLLVAASDPGLLDTELLPRRLPGGVFRDVVLLEQPFEKAEETVGGYPFDVGYAPWRNAEGRVIGAVSVPLLNQRRLRDRELASAETAVLGLYLASLLAAVAAGRLLAARLTKPLSDLTDAAKRVARGDVEHPVPGTAPDELGEVVAAFNQMQRDLGESRAKLVRAEKEAAWRDMARQVAHEVKNPLTPMRLAAEHLRRAWRDGVPHFDDVLERGVDLIVRQTESLQRIATAFGDFARFPNRRREPVDLAALVDESLDLWRETPGLEIRRDVERPLPALLADPDELRRVLVNLTKNAVEAFDGAKGTLTATLVREGGSLVLTLADDGPGIPDDVLPRLFEPSFSTKTKGSGLGLAICRRAVEDLGGTITIASRRGEGTTVTVRLPCPPEG